jgi:hypothetical protein
MSPSFTVFSATAQHTTQEHKVKPSIKVVGTKRTASQTDMAPDRAAKKRQRTDPLDADGKKARGRPRVEGEDETAADVCESPTDSQSRLIWE